MTGTFGEVFGPRSQTEIWPFSCDFNSELALAQPFYNQLASLLDL